VETNVGVELYVSKGLSYKVVIGGRCGGCNGKLNMVYTKIYNEINVSKKLLMFKFDGLQKHIMRWKCKLACSRCITR